MQTTILAGPLTILVWLVACAAGGLVFARTHRAGDGVGRVIPRVMCGVMVMLSVWSVAVYALWLADVPLKVGTIEEGKMGENWWLPGVTVIWAALSYRALR